jgi:hypothetical protein
MFVRYCYGFLRRARTQPCDSNYRFLMNTQQLNLLLSQNKCSPRKSASVVLREKVLLLFWEFSNFRTLVPYGNSVHKSRFRKHITFTYSWVAFRIAPSSREWNINPNAEFIKEGVSVVSKHRPKLCIISYCSVGYLLDLHKFPQLSNEWRFTYICNKIHTLERTKRPMCAFILLYNVCNIYFCWSGV